MLSRARGHCKQRNIANRGEKPGEYDQRVGQWQEEWDTDKRCKLWEGKVLEGTREEVLESVQSPPL
jgi:hypothetical protein